MPDKKKIMRKKKHKYRKKEIRLVFAHTKIMGGWSSGMVESAIIMPMLVSELLKRYLTTTCSPNVNQKNGIILHPANAYKRNIN